jgi:hypothetical protein
LRVGYSILREINKRNFLPCGVDYGLTQVEFERFIFFLVNKGYLERVLKVDDYFSLNPARLTLKGLELLEHNKQYEETYPERKDLIAWVKFDKDLYSNAAEEE